MVVNAKLIRLARRVVRWLVQTRLRQAGLVGAVLSAGYFTWHAGPPPLANILDVFVWLVDAIVALLGAFAGISVFLAWRHARQSPRWLFGTLLGLLLFSLPIVLEFIRETRETKQFLAASDSIGGVVASRYIRGGVVLIVDYEVAGKSHQIRRVGEIPTFGTPAFCQLSSGDNIPVYYLPAKPDVALIGQRGPERRILIESLVKVWIKWGVLLTAYLPLIVRGWPRFTAFIRQAIAEYQAQGHGRHR
jgi:hypothetical protein